MRNRLIELLDNIFEGRKTLGDIADYIIDNGVTVQEWISVKDRLPELHEEAIKDEGETIRYMVSNPFLAYTDKGVMTVCVYIVQDGREWWNEDSGTEHKVTHWMPLPQPPKGE